MVSSQVKTVKFAEGCLSYHQAVSLEEQLCRQDGQARIVLDLQDTPEATTAALAKLVVLRRRLRMSGGDLCLAHICGRTRDLYEINRMSGLLPCQLPAD